MALTVTGETVVEAPLDKLRRLQQLRQARRRQIPHRYRATWQCDRAGCDGEPHHDGTVGHKHARAEQIIPPDVDTAYLVGGRGSGKTWAGARNTAQMILDTDIDDGDDHTEWAVVAPTYKDARDVCIEGPSGLLRALRHGQADSLVKRWDRTYGKLTLVTGAVVWVDAANEGALRIQGKNLYGGWFDEVGLWRNWKQAWEESIGFAVRKGRGRRICTGTPKRSSLAKHLLDDPAVWRHRLRTLDNAANLSPEVLQRLLDRFKDTTLGQQELEGILLGDVEGAIWRRQLLDELRVDRHEPKFWLRKILALDPSDGADTSDEQGLALVGHSAEDHHLYVLHSDGDRLTPWDWLTKAVTLARAEQATIVVEKNHGGAYLTGLLEQVMDKQGFRVPYTTVDAGTAKRTRAETVAGLYEQRRVHHVGLHADLEDQQCSWTGSGREPSPDRMDALVWALTPFVGTPMKPPSGDRDTVAQWDTGGMDYRDWAV